MRVSKKMSFKDRQATDGWTTDAHMMTVAQSRAKKSPINWTAKEKKGMKRKAKKKKINARAYESWQ